MQVPDNDVIFEFEEFQLDVRGRTLRRGGETVTVTAKVFDALAILVSSQGRVVEKDELLRTIWPNTVVEEGNVHHYISTLRKVLGENGTHRFIATVPGRGYSFVSPVRVRPRDMEDSLEDGLAAPASAVAPRPEAPASRRRRWLLATTGLLAGTLVGIWGWQLDSPARFG